MSFGASSSTRRLLAAFALSASLVSPAAAQVLPFFGITGQVSVSVDAAGSFEGLHTIEVEKPSDSAEVFVAFLMMIGSGARVVVDGAVVLDGVPVTVSGAFVNAPPNLPGFFYNALADVTAIVKPVVDAAPPGRVSFGLAETGSGSIDGEVLVVVFEDPSQADDRTVVLAFGGSSETPDDYVLTLLDPIDPGEPGAVADFGLGISSSTQGDPDFAPTARSVRVDKTLVTSAAGGVDDGGRITAGGLGDSNANPADPGAGPGPDSRSDDELYSLLPFLSPDATRLEISTALETPLDNYFFAYWVLSDFGAINEGVLLRPEFEVNEVGTDHTVVATVVDGAGLPLPGVEVTFDVFSGPNAGTTGSATTDAAGEASFTYTGDGGEGFDAIDASVVLGAIALSSNVAVKEWITPLEVSLAPADSVNLVGADQVLEATVTDASGAPLSGVEVTIEVLTGPNAGQAQTAATGAAGTVSFTYTGLAAGIDEARASVVDVLGVTRTSNLALVDWRVAAFGEPRPDVAVSDRDRILVVRESGTVFTDIAGVVLDRDGEELAQTTVNDETAVHRSPAVAGLDDGSFIVVYVRLRPVSNVVMGRFVGDDGVPRGAAFPIDDACDICAVEDVDLCMVARPAVAALPGGGFVVVYQKLGGVEGRILDAAGQFVGDFFVAVGAAAPAVAAFEDGSFVVAYEALGAGFDEIRQATFDASGALVADVAASRFTDGLQAEPAAAATLGGDPVVLWESYSDATGAGIFGRVDSGAPGSPEFQVNSQILGDQLWPALAVEPRSGLVAGVWTDASRGVVAAQRFSPGLFFVSRELTVDPSIFLGTSGDAPVLGRARVASLADGTLVVAVGVASSAADPDGGAGVGFAEPTPLAACFADGELTCVKNRLGKVLRPPAMLR